MKKILRDNKGSISALVVISVLLYSIVLTTVFMQASSKRKMQMESQILAKEAYEKQLDNLDEIRDEVIGLPRTNETQPYYPSREFKQVKEKRKQYEEKLAQEKDMFSHLTSDVFDKIEPIDLTRAVIFHINAKEDRLYEDDNYDGNIIPYLTHEELLIYTMYQLECSLEGGRGSIHSFFITEPYCNYRPYYKEAFETMKCYDIAHLLEEAEKLAILIENDQEDEIDETSEYATYNFSDFTNEFVSLLRSSGIGDKLGEYIKEHKESFIEKDDENEKRISE